MKTILEDNISYDTKIKDFGVDSVNKRIITTGYKGKKSALCFQHIFCFYTKWESLQM